MRLSPAVNSTSPPEPQYPILVFFADGDVWTHDNLIDLLTALEWFDSEAPEEEATVFDALGRRLVVKIVALDLVELRLADGGGAA